MLPVEHNDPVNAKILAVSEDKIEGFVREPFEEIANRSGVAVEVVMARIAAMLRAGTIRRVRQTLLATNLAEGALVAWKVPEEKIDAAFDWMFQRDPFSGHVVLRSTDTVSAGSDYKLWTTVKAPQGFSLQAHCELLAKKVGAERFRLMPAKGIFTLGVGHVRRKTIEPGSKADQPAKMMPVQRVELSEHEWDVLLALKREFTPEEVKPSPWVSRANEAGVSLEEFCRVAEDLNARKIVGRFSTFLEHVKPSAGGVRVTRFNALFHWAIPPGREIETGGEVGRHHILTHCYWREAGPEFRNVNIMAVAHGTDKRLLLEHKAAIDRHLRFVRNPGFLHERVLGRAQRDQAVGDFAARLSRMVVGAGEVKPARFSLINCTVSGNSTDGTGGGICADANATLTIDSSTISGNYAGDYGGGIANNGTLTINNSTLSSNRGEFAAGAILNGFNGDASLTVSNSTLSGNTTQLHGGGIFNEGQSAIGNSTLSGNSGMTAGAIYNRLATLDIESTILNRGELGPNILNDGTVTSHGYNLSSDDGGGVLNGPGDQINTNPLLGPLQNNGGPTFTHQLLPGQSGH